MDTRGREEPWLQHPPPAASIPCPASIPILQLRRRLSEGFGASSICRGCSRMSPCEPTGKLFLVSSPLETRISGAGGASAASLELPSGQMLLVLSLHGRGALGHGCGWLEKRWKTTESHGTAELGWNCSSEFIPGRIKGGRMWILGWGSAEITTRVFFHSKACACTSGCPKTAPKARRLHCLTVKSILQLCQCLNPKFNQLIKYFIVNFIHYIIFLKTEL